MIDLVVASEPSWLTVARTYLGTRERLPNGKVNPLIAEFFQSTKFKGGDADDAWCSAFANHCMRKAGVRGSGRANARSWLDWGVALEQPTLGCVVVFSRPPKPSEGHVSFFVGADKNYITVLGGNQNNAVCVRPYPRARVLQFRMP
jgi:uncharacterized protein (TIGR02594 family)